MDFLKTLFQLFNYLFISAFEFSPFIMLITFVGITALLSCVIQAFFKGSYKRY